MVKRCTRLSTEAARRVELKREMEVGGPDFLSVEIESQTRLLVSVVRTRMYLFLSSSSLHVLAGAVVMRSLQSYRTRITR